jgi:glycosyltransferase involved in cell wall biosynthesis
MKVLHVVNSLGRGSAGMWLMEVLRLWRRDGTDAAHFDFLATGRLPDYHDEEARRYGCGVRHVADGRFYSQAFARGLREMLRAGRYDVIHDHADYASGWHFLAGRGALPALRITHLHPANDASRTDTLSRRPRAGLGGRFVARYATHIAAPSQQVLSDYGFDAPRFAHVGKVILHRGFDTALPRDVTEERQAVRREFGWPVDARIILFTGRIDPSPDADNSWNEKDAAFAIAIVAEAARRDQRIRMILAGAKSAAVRVLEHRVAEAGFAGHMQFAEVPGDRKRLMCAADLLLLPSRAEEPGMAAVEAQAAGLPVLASTVVSRDCVVVPQLVRFESLQHGASAWAASLLDHAARPREIAEANRRVAASPFGIKNSAAALMALYRQQRPA